MPKEYEHMRDAMIMKGMPIQKAKKFAAIQYYKKTGKAVKKGHRGSK